MAALSATWPQRAQAYRTPALLSDIRLLDLLELSGSTRGACRLLKISQPTVSRRYRALADDFGLQAEPEMERGCRFGSNATMRLLRLSCRCHRLEAGVARLGADMLHHGLLGDLPWLLPSPPRFRPAREWLELVRQGILDGALVSQLELDQEPPSLDGDLEWHPLGRLRLALTWAVSRAGAGEDTPQRVLVPEEGQAAGLRALLSREGWTLRRVASGCTTPEQWLQLLRRSGCAMPVPDGLGPAGGKERLASLPLGKDAVSRVWLALPRWREAPDVLRHTLEQLQRHPALQA